MWQRDKFKVEGILSRSTSGNGGGLAVCVRGGGGGCTQQKMRGGEASFFTSGAYTWKKGDAGQRTSESGMEVLIHCLLKVIEISAGLHGHIMFVKKQNVLVICYMPLMATKTEKAILN